MWGGDLSAPSAFHTASRTSACVIACLREGRKGGEGRSGVRVQVHACGKGKTIKTALPHSSRQAAGTSKEKAGALQGLRRSAADACMLGIASILYCFGREGVDGRGRG